MKEETVIDKESRKLLTVAAVVFVICATILAASIEYIPVIG